MHLFLHDVLPEPPNSATEMRQRQRQWATNTHSGQGAPKMHPTTHSKGPKTPWIMPTHRCKIDARSEDAPWDSPRFQGSYWGPRQPDHGGPEAREPLAAPLWEAPGSKQCAAAMQRRHHGNCTQCCHQWCTLPPHHTHMKGPGNVHKHTVPSWCMRCAMMEQGDNGMQAPPEYQGRHWRPPTNIMSRDSGPSAAHKACSAKNAKGHATTRHPHKRAPPMPCADCMR